MAKRKKRNGDDGVRKRRRPTNVADWGGANPALLAEVIQLIAARGGAVRFGYSSDGGAFCLGIYGDGKPFSEYLPGDQDVDGWLEGFRIDYE